uniref:DUF6708 domain-containing protein n=2 Tax=Xanthomonas oryzae TaxID=347 RepID=UPI003DA02848
MAPLQRLGLVSISSTFIEWIDRRFLYRGMLNMSVVFIVLIGFFAFSGFCFLKMAQGGRGAWAIGVMGIMSMGCAGFLYAILLRHEFFRYVYYPIRFNRKTRKIYVFREKRDGGLLIVPWDEVFFHIGRGTDMKFLRDIRGEILDGEIVKDTFALGHCAERDEPVKEMWERLDSISKCNTLSAVRVCTCQKAINTSVRKSAQCSRSRRGAVKVCARFPGF